MALREGGGDGPGGELEHGLAGPEAPALGEVVAQLQEVTARLEQRQADLTEVEDLHAQGRRGHPPPLGPSSPPPLPLPLPLPCSPIHPTNLTGFFRRVHPDAWVSLFLPWIVRLRARAFLAVDPNLHPSAPGAPPPRPLARTTCGGWCRASPSTRSPASARHLTPPSPLPAHPRPSRDPDRLLNHNHEGWDLNNSGFCSLDWIMMA